MSDILLALTGIVLTLTGLIAIAVLTAKVLFPKPYVDPVQRQYGDER